METRGGKNDKLMLSHEDHGAVSQAHCFPRAEAEVGATGRSEVLDVKASAACLVDGAVASLEVAAGDSGVLTGGRGGRGREGEKGEGRGASVYVLT